MAQFIALAVAPLRINHAELLRGAIVCSCGMALLLAGHSLPF